MCEALLFRASCLFVLGGGLRARGEPGNVSMRTAAVEYLTTNVEWVLAQAAANSSSPYWTQARALKLPPPLRRVPMDPRVAHAGVVPRARRVSHACAE
jgi:hypothetical protein